jgi:hypothetical protein
MNTRVTVAVARASCEQFASSPAQFIPQLNLVQQKLMAHAMWQDLLQAVDFKNSSGTGVLTMPPWVASVVGWQLFGTAEAVFDQFREFQEGGVGFYDSKSYKANELWELPAGAVSQNSIPDYGGYGNLRLFINNPADAGKVVRFGGQDQNGEEIYDSAGNQGVSLTTAFPSSDTSQLFGNLSNVQLPGFVGSCNLYVLINGVASLLSYYNPGETLPYYRKYKVGQWSPKDANIPNVAPIRCFCRRQFMPCHAETDFVYPGNLNAIEAGLQALRERRALNFSVARIYWADAYGELDNDLQQYRGAAETTLRLEGMALPRGGDCGWQGSWVN